ncbi:MAG: hypothetical protein NTY09_03550, partial [bacterium]|nr:hypothetical protein [bacterium]
MYYLAILFPKLLGDRPLPFTRDQVMMWMIVINEFFLGVDHFLAHMISGNIWNQELYPIIAGPVTGVFLIIAILMERKSRLASSIIATIPLLATILMGLYGEYLHINRTFIEGAPMGQKVTIDTLVWAVPIIAPLTASFIGVLGISAAWQEEPADSGLLVLNGRTRLQLPFSKTRAYFFLVALGILACLISSVLDHARTHFVNPWLWFPYVGGLFSVMAAVLLGVINNPSKGDLTIYAFAMFILILIGLVGTILHIHSVL